MGKNHRHKKNLKADKAKVKLKQTKTKFLPKGQNVTNTSFKIKPIVLQEQLREKVSDVPLSKRKLDIKDLLSRMKHYNENVRHKACEEMAEMVKLYSEEIINHHLSVVVLSVSTLMQDKEGKVRKAAVNIVNAILGIVPDEKLEPFYHYFLVNLRCAMTNINKNIQEDSLIFLDSFLMNNSQMVRRNPEKLLPDFFTLISKLRSESNLGRTLTVNLGSKMTSVTWRIKVLSRLHAVLEKILNQNNDGSVENDELKNVFNADTCNTFPLYKTKFGEKLTNTNVYTSNSEIVNTSSVDNLEMNILTVVPLLYETWVEVMPEKKSTKPSTEHTILNDEAAAILACVMSTLYLLWKYVSKLNSDDLVKKVFLSAEGKKFFDHLVHYFPYRQPESRNKKVKMSNELKLLEMNSDMKCYKENILISLIYSALSINVSKRSKNIQIDRVVEYLSDLLSSNVNLKENNCQYLFEFLKMSLQDNYNDWRKSGVNLRLILSNAIQFYYRKNLSITLKLDLFTLLASLVDSFIAQKSDQYLSWVESLPNLLTEPQISDLEVNCLLNMSKRGSNVFHEALNRKIPKVMDNLDHLQIVMYKENILNTEDIVMRNIANILFFLPKIGKIKSRIICEYIAAHQESKYADYLSKMLQLRKDFKR